MDNALKRVVESHMTDPESIHSELMRREVIYALGVAKTLGPYCKELPVEDRQMIDYVKNKIKPECDERQSATRPAPA